uniref:Fibronectin type III and ankyrin repeat domains 1 n=1 Tax=Chelonoidis abingdonii TaxID=106734 RepID=A0A8C0HDP0_CHEAB
PPPSSCRKHTIPKPHPPVVGEVTHHSIQLSWDLENTAQRKGPQEQWLKISIEEEDPKLHTYGTIYTGYARQHVIEGLQPRTTYRFRLKVTSSTGECSYSPAVSVSTTREPMSGEQLHRAVSMNDVEAVLNILQGGVTVDMKSQHLMLACFSGHLDIIKYLREQGASWEVRDLGGCTALHWAVDGGHCEVIEWMINDGCQVDAKDTCLEWTPLMRVSAVTGNKDVASLLIEAGADVNVKDKDGKTPLMSVVMLLEENKRKLSENTNCPPPVLGSQAREVTK